MKKGRPRRFEEARKLKQSGPGAFDLGLGERADEDADAQLGEALSDISSRFPDNRDIMVISEPSTSYGDIVAVMDISRESGMPSVSLLGAK